MPPPTESQILSTTLLTPSALPTILPLSAFKALFPASQRSNPQITTLYRSLQHERGLDLDLVRENIALEARKGELQKREVARTRSKEGGLEGGEEELLLLDADQGAERRGRMVLGGLEGGKGQGYTAASIVPALEEAVRGLEAEVGAMEEEREGLRREMEGIVGGLSDLRYGKLRKGEGEEVLEALREVEGEIDRVGKRKRGMDGDS